MHEIAKNPKSGGTARHTSKRSIPVADPNRHTRRTKSDHNSTQFHKNK